MLKALEDGQEAQGGAGQKGPNRASLRDQFKMLRMREEAGISSLEDPEKVEGGAIAGLIGRTTSLGVGIGSPTSVADDKDSGLAVSPVTSPQSLLPPASPIDPKLAPARYRELPRLPLMPRCQSIGTFGNR